MSKFPTDRAEVAAWQLLSFFSLRSQEQRALIGTANEWFCDENERNVGANYLFGCKVAGTLLILSLRDRFDEASEDLEEVVRCLNNLPPCNDMKVWSSNAIGSAKCWQDLRVLATHALSAMGLYGIQLYKPLVIENLIEVEGYRAG